MFVYLVVTAITFVVTLVIFTLSLVVLWKWRIGRFPDLPCPPAVPIIGSAYYFCVDPHELFLQMIDYSHIYNNTFVLWFFLQPVIISSEVKYVESVLGSQEHIRKSLFYNFLHPWLGTGLLTSTGKKWKSRRRAITPSFHFSILNNFQEVFVKHSHILVQQLRKLTTSGEPIEIQELVSLASLDIICETAMGVSTNAQTTNDNCYVKAINEVNKEVQLRQKSPWYWPDCMYRFSSSAKNFQKNLKIMHDFTIGVINRRIECRNKTLGQQSADPSRLNIENNTESNIENNTDSNIENNTDSNNRPKKFAFLDMLLDLYDRDEIDVEGIREEVDTFMFEGHDTTASGLSWILYCLGKNLDVQRKLHAEIDTVAKSIEESSESNLVNQIKGLPYLENVIKEGLRLHPPVPFFGRTLESDTEIDGKTIPAGTELIISSIPLQTNREYWDEPHRFNPDRFNEEKYLKRNPYIYVPFSAGPRNCIGQKFAMIEEKIMLYHVMLNFEVRCTQREEEVEACFEIIHKSNNGLYVKLLPRS